MKIRTALIMASAVFALTGCSKHGWSVEGTVDNAPDGAKLAIEGFNAGRWYNIDSVEIGSNGHFSYRAPEGSPYPDIYRVSLDGRGIYFPIDSLEHITINTDADNFDIDYTESGWQLAEEMMRIDKRIAEVVASKGATGALNDSILKREISVAINEDDNGMLGYYLINKTIGDRPLFSTTDRADLRILGALANKFSTKYPTDPRTAYLTELFIRSRSNLNGAPQTLIEANEAGLFEIELYDAKGEKQKLSELAKRSGITLLSFTSYLMDGSVPYNVELNRLYELFGPNNIGIYQISLDSDEVQWRQSAKNLPWTAVWYDQQDGGSLIRIYNVGILPTTFVIDRNGDLVERVEDPTQLEAAIRKHI